MTIGADNVPKASPSTITSATAMRKTPSDFKKAFGTGKTQDTLSARTTASVPKARTPKRKALEMQDQDDEEQIVVTPSQNAKKGLAMRSSRSGTQNGRTQ